jgi:hypothetical protein
MYQVKCPDCGGERSVRARKPWMVGSEPFLKICKSCCQKGKEKTPECRAKLSEAVKRLQTEEVVAKKSQFMKDHPEVWGPNLVFGAGGGWNKGMKMGATPEETKQKISESMKKTLAEKKEGKK